MFFFLLGQRRRATCSPQETHAHKETDTRASLKHVRAALIIASTGQKKRRKRPETGFIRSPVRSPVGTNRIGCERERVSVSGSSCV